MNPAVTPPLSSLNKHSGLRVLVVDDDPLQLEVNADLLRGLGVLDITISASAELALNAIAKAKGPSAFNLMLSDLHMPGIDGFQFMEAVARNGFAGALIIVSGQNSTVVHSATLVAQLRRFKLLGTLGKPVERAKLAELLAKLVS